jgi:hypothetical protein
MVPGLRGPHHLLSRHGKAWPRLNQWAIHEFACDSTVLAHRNSWMPSLKLGMTVEWIVGMECPYPAPPVKTGNRAARPPMMNSTAIEAMIRPMTRLKMVIAVALI